MFNSVLGWIRHTLWILCLVSIIFFAIGINVLRLLLPTLAQPIYLERITLKLVHVPIAIGRVSTGWHGLQPCIYLNNVRILPSMVSGIDQPVPYPLLTIEHVTLQINLLSSLVHWQVILKRLVIDGAILHVNRDQNGQFFGVLPDRNDEKHTVVAKSILIWLFTQSDITLSHINLFGQFEQSVGASTKLALTHLTMRIHNNFFEHYVNTTFNWGDKPDTAFQIIANITAAHSNLNNADAKVYVFAKNIKHDQFDFLKTILPQLNHYSIEDIQGSFKIWLQFNKGKLKNSVIHYALAHFKTNKIALFNALGDLEWSRIHHRTTIHLANKTALLQIYSLFKQPIPIGHVDADVNYFHSAQEWDLQASKININNGIVTLNALLSLTQYQDKPMHVDLSGQFGIADLSGISAFLPQKMDSNMLAWCQQAFLAGRLEQGIFSYRGSLATSTDNQFDLTGHLTHLALSYAPGWPIVKNSDIRVVIHNKWLTAFSRHVESVGNVIDQLSLNLPLQKKAVLNLTLHTQSNLQQGWQYIEHTPLHLAKMLASLQLHGPMDLNMTVQLPLHKQSLSTATTFGTLTTHAGILKLPRWNITLDHIKGTIAFHDKELNDDGHGLQAVLFGKPMQLRVKTVKNLENSILELNTQSTLSIADISEHFSLPLTQFFKGSSVFAADLALHSSQTQGNDLHIATNLLGVASQGVPSPFAKNENEPRSVKLDVTLRDNKPLYLRIDYAHLASLALIYDKAQHGFKLRSGNIQLGGNQAVYLPTPGLIIQGYLAELDCLLWQKFLSPLFSSQRARVAPNNLPIRLISLHIGALQAYHTVFKDLFLTAESTKNAFKVGVINSSLNGSLLIPNKAHQQWMFDFKRLYLQKLNNKTDFYVDPAALPPLKINIAHFKWDTQFYHSIQLLTEPIVDGLLIKNLTMQTQDSTLHAHGWWKNVGVQQQTGLSGILNTENLGQLISPWEKDSILGGKGYAHFSLHWYGKPMHIDWHHADGVITFYFKNGSLLMMDRKTASEIGIGQLLNLLSVDAIFKRLETHFRDVTQKGLWFDVLNGQLFLNQGIATAKLIDVSGPVVKIKAQGQLNLSQHTSNIRLYVVPQLTSSFPAIAGIVGGPLAGAVVWMANKLVGQQINKMSASTYSVTGPWKHLNIAKN